MKQPNIELVKYPSQGRLELHISAARYEELDQAAQDLEQQSLYTLSQTEPTEAYVLIKKSLGAMAVRTDGVHVANRLVAQATLDGTGATAHRALYEIGRMMPEPYESAFHFSVAVYTSDEDKEVLGLTDNTIEIIALEVTPPNYP